MLKVIEVALNEVGYLEKASNKDLYSKTGNAGSANWTKFAKELDDIDFYNGKKNGYAWCDVFVDFCFVKAYGSEMAKKLLCQPNRSLGASCYYSANYFKQAGQFYSSPKIGDQIFFGNNDDVVHTGLVYAIDDTRVYTVEGNTSDASGVIPNGGGVFKKSYSRSYSRIYGYGRPNYALVGEDDNSSGGAIMISMAMLSKGDNGKEVKTLQALLIKKFGIGCGISGMDGDFGSATESAVKTFQRKYGLDVDGIVGANTWNKLLK